MRRGESRALVARLAAVAVLAIASPAPIRGAGPRESGPAGARTESARAVDSKQDSIVDVRWSLLYAGRIDCRRRSDRFPWNDPEAASHINDRLAAMCEFYPRPFISIFAKVSSGFRREEEGVYRGRLALAQAHARFESRGRTIGGRLFLRERAYRSDHRLLQLVSSDASFFDGRGEGVRLVLAVPARLRVTYTESVLRSGDSAVTGGLPSFRGGGDVFRMVDASVSIGGAASLGLFASEIRSIDVGDGVMIGTNAAVGARGVRLVAELARTLRGRWDDLRRARLYDIEPDRARGRAMHEIFSANAAFASEIHGIEIDDARIGTVALVPGYRCHGSEFFDPQGEIGGGLVESRLTSWWRHPRFDAGVTVELADLWSEDVGGGEARRHRLFQTLSRARLTNGLELRESALFVEGRRPSWVVTVLDESRIARTLAAVRLDDAGGENDVSFVAEGQMNLAPSWSLRTALVLHRSRESRYAMELEFRPGSRFLLRAAIGSFRPCGDPTRMERDVLLEAPPKERRLTIYTRFWFGTM